MRVSPKLVLLVVCVLAGTVFYQGCQNEAEMAVKEEVKDVNADQSAIGETSPLGGVEEKKEEDVTAAAPAVEPIATKPAETIEDKDAAVTVNGKVITEADLDARLKPIIERASMRMDPNSIEMNKGRIRNQTLEGMIMENLLDEQVVKAGITITDKDVNDKIGEILAKQGMTMDGFRQTLQMQGLSETQFRQQMEKGLGYEKLMELKAGAGDINDAEALAFYEKNKEDFNSPEQVHASHILIKVAPTATPEEKAAAKEKLEKILKQVNEGGDFAALARENSDCPSKAKGGDLGFFEKGQMVKEFEQAAFALQPGQVSDVVETQFGYHIIKVTNRKEAGLTPFEKAKDDIIKNLQQGKKNQLFRQYVQNLREEANVVYPAGKEPPVTPGMPGAPATK